MKKRKVCISIVFAYAYEMPKEIRAHLLESGIDLNKIDRESISIINYHLDDKAVKVNKWDYYAFKLFKFKTPRLINFFNNNSFNESGKGASGQESIRVEYKIIKSVLLIKHN